MKGDADHGDWIDWVNSNLPFSDRTAQKLMGIASFETFHQQGIYDVLPASWATLDTLRNRAANTPAGFQAALDEKLIKSDMTRSDVVEAFKPTTTTASNNNDKDDADDADDALEALIGLSERGTQYGCIYVDPP